MSGDDKETQNGVLKTIVWFQRIFWTYLIMYFMYVFWIKDKLKFVKDIKGKKGR